MESPGIHRRVAAVSLSSPYRLNYNNKDVGAQKIKLTEATNRQVFNRHTFGPMH